MSALNARQARFVDEYLVDLNATQAAIRAGYSAKTAEAQGSRLLSNVKVAAAVAEAQRARSERTEITADAVLARLWVIATADPRELIEYRRTCCRHCHGRGFRFQRTPAEMERDRATHEKLLAKQGDGPEPPPPFDEAGGIGYNATLPPHPACPECFGEGVERAFVHDTRNLSPAAATLYAGVKVTRDGIEVKMHDQQSALVTVGKHLGMFTDRVEHTGKDGGPIETRSELAGLPLDELIARRNALLGTGA